MFTVSICHNCGNSKVITGQPCLSCGEVISDYSATELPQPSILSKPLSIDLNLDLTLSEKVLTNIRLKKLIKDNNTNSNGQPNVLVDSNGQDKITTQSDLGRSPSVINHDSDLSLFDEEIMTQNDVTFRQSKQTNNLNNDNVVKTENEINRVIDSDLGSVKNNGQNPDESKYASISLENLVENLNVNISNIISQTQSSNENNLDSKPINENTNLSEVRLNDSPRAYGQVNSTEVNSDSNNGKSEPKPNINLPENQRQYGQISGYQEAQTDHLVKDNIFLPNQPNVNLDESAKTPKPDLNLANDNLIANINLGISEPATSPKQDSNPLDKKPQKADDNVTKSQLNLLNFDFNPIPGQESKPKPKPQEEVLLKPKTEPKIDYIPQATRGFDDFPSLKEINDSQNLTKEDLLSSVGIEEKSQFLNELDTKTKESRKIDDLTNSQTVHVKPKLRSFSAKTNKNPDIESSDSHDLTHSPLAKAPIKDYQDLNENIETKDKTVKKQNFSGESQKDKDSWRQKPLQKRQQLDNNDNDDIDDKTGDDLDNDENPGKFGFLNNRVNILGISLPLTSVIVIGLIAFFIVSQMISGITTILSNTAGLGSGFLNFNANNHPSLSGSWQFVAVAQGQKCEGIFNLEENNNQIIGEGHDTSGNFELIGSFTQPNKISFVKRYYVNGQEVFKPVNYEGLINFEQKPLYMQGNFNLTFRQNYGWRGHPVTVNGQWESILIKPSQDNSANKAHHIQANNFNPLNNLTNSFTYAAVGGIGLAVFLIFYSIHLFGPNGKIQIEEKQRYVTSQFKSQHKKMLKEMSAAYRIGGLSLGTRVEWKPYKFWETKELALTPKIREKNPHMIILGTANKGKSRLLANFITQDILANDRCVVVIDSDGGLVDLIAQWIASHEKGKTLAKRVILLDPTQKNQMHSYNPLELTGDGNLQAAASAIVYGFKAIYTEPPGSQSQWNAQTANILRNSALLLTANGKTLTDLPTLLQDHDTRDILLEGVERKKRDHVEFATLLETWGQYKKLARTEQWVNWVEPILNRVTPMLSDPRIRPILTHPNGTINLNDIIAQKKILLVKIPQGQLDQNANLLGSLIVTGLKQAAINLSSTSAHLLHTTSLYLDEFDSFIEKETFDSLTSDTAKFQIGITAVAKSIQHLPEEYRNYLIIHVGSIVAFALAKKDADLLGPQMFRVDGRKRKHQTMQNFFNRVNSSPQFEMISDEEKLNIDRLIGQDDRTYFIYRVGSIAGVFHMKSHEFKDINPSSVSKRILDIIKGVNQG